MEKLSTETSSLYQYHYQETENTAVDSIFNELFQQLEESLQSH